MINAAEKAAITQEFPDVHVVRTMKQDSKRHHYYMVEEPGPMAMLRDMRGIKQPKKKKHRCGGKRYNREGNNGS